MEVKLPARIADMDDLIITVQMVNGEQNCIYIPVVMNQEDTYRHLLNHMEHCLFFHEVFPHESIKVLDEPLANRETWPISVRNKRIKREKQIKK